MPPDPERLRELIAEKCPWGVYKDNAGRWQRSSSTGRLWPVLLTPAQILDAVMEKPCERCDGEGEYPFAPILPHTLNPCPTCNGTGSTIDNPELREFILG